MEQHANKQETFDSLHTMKVEIYDDFDAITYLQEEWDAFVESVAGDIYLTYDWCQTWWDFYGTGRQLRIFLFRNDNILVGVIPIFYEKQLIGPVWLKLAKIVGSDYTMVMINPPVQADCAVSVYGHLFEALFKDNQVDAIWLGPTSGKYSALQQLREAIRTQSKVTLLCENIRSPYTTFFLPRTFEAYVQSLNKRQRGNLRRDLN